MGSHEAHEVDIDKKQKIEEEQVIASQTVTGAEASSAQQDVMTYGPDAGVPGPDADVPGGSLGVTNPPPAAERLKSGEVNGSPAGLSELASSHATSAAMPDATSDATSSATALAFATSYAAPSTLNPKPRTRAEYSTGRTRSAGPRSPLEAGQSQAILAFPELSAGAGASEHAAGGGPSEALGEFASHFRLPPGDADGDFKLPAGMRLDLDRQPVGQWHGAARWRDLIELPDKSTNLLHSDAGNPETGNPLLSAMGLPNLAPNPSLKQHCESPLASEDYPLNPKP
eukprot:jgi/Mesen1/3355/ME000191S02491